MFCFLPGIAEMYKTAIRVITNPLAAGRRRQWWWRRFIGKLIKGS